MAQLHWSRLAPSLAHYTITITNCDVLFFTAIRNFAITTQDFINERHAWQTYRCLTYVNLYSCRVLSVREQIEIAPLVLEIARVGLQHRGEPPCLLTYYILAHYIR